MSLTQDKILNDSPWWARTLWVVGPVTLIAMWLIYWVTGRVNFDLGTIHANQAVIISDENLIKENLALHNDAASRTYSHLEEYMRIQNNITRQICVNAAANLEQRNNCFKDQ